MVTVLGQQFIRHIAIGIPATVTLQVYRFYILQDYIPYVRAGIILNTLHLKTLRV